MESPLCHADSPVLLASISLNQCIKLVLSFHDVTPEYRMGISHFFDTSRLWVFEDTMQVYIPCKNLYAWVNLY